MMERHEVHLGEFYMQGLELVSLQDVSMHHIKIYFRTKTLGMRRFPRKPSPPIQTYKMRETR